MEQILRETAESQRFGLGRGWKCETVQLQNGESTGSTRRKRWQSQICDSCDSRWQTQRPVVKQAPLFYESVFQEKNRAGNVGASHQQAKKFDSKHAGWETKPKFLKT